MINIPKLLDLYIRVAILVLSVTFGILILFAGARAALAANLRSISVIKGDTLTLGDVFEGLNDGKAAYVLGPAPMPGQDMVLNAPTLMRIALALDLPWQPASSTDQIIVRRAAAIVSETDLRTVIADGLKDKGLDGKFNLKLAGNLPQIILPPDSVPTAEITAMKFDPDKDMFEASIAAPSANTPLVRATISGRVQRLASVPVLKNTLRNGDIISTTDISWIDMDVKDMQDDLLLREDDFTGKTPRRMISAGKPVRNDELQRPQLVGRGDFVTLIFQSGPITLTAKGKTLQDGAKGDIVRFVNIASNRTLDGIVSGNREITVSE